MKSNVQTRIIDGINNGKSISVKVKGPRKLENKIKIPKGIKPSISTTSAITTLIMIINNKKL